jgi:NADH-quinone oxidoreductase subunit F
MKLSSAKDLAAAREAARGLIQSEGAVLAVGMGTCGIGNGAEDVYDAIAAALALGGPGGAPVRLKKTGCFGFCAEEPVVTLFRPGAPALVFSRVTRREVPALVKAARESAAAERAARSAMAKIETWDFLTRDPVSFGTGYPSVPRWNELPFFKGQAKIVLRDAGLVDPESLDEYLAVGGYGALAKALGDLSPEAVIAEVTAAKLRGRGGAGFPTGRKWSLMRAQEGAEKWVICNADEGDPGAYMNRNEIESDPHALIEGMAIGAYAMGARRGFVYIRAEYPLAIARLRRAIEAAKERGLLGEKILGSAFDFDLEIVQGAGAFVCGEETALIASAEGKAGRPLPRPPFPAQRGYAGAPTTINNVETWFNVPVILSKGAAWFASVGTEKSAGTKVFSLVGKVKNTGLVELPLGTPLDRIVFGMGGGAGARKTIRAVQTGGPSGGCIPIDLFGTPVDYESLAAIGAIMGSGGMVVMDSDNCMVDVARYFVSFTAAESCGKCVPCREGLSQMLRILDGVSRGEASEADLDELEALAIAVRDSALCGLGQTAANPVLTTLAHFKDEFLAHIREKRCEAGICESLFTALCQNSCPLSMRIPAYLQLLKEGKIEDAFELTLRDNPLPGTVGRICHFHCQMRCRRDTLDEPVAQGEIHRYLADTMYKLGREKAVYAKLAAEKFPSTGKRVAVIGAGPAGLAAAYWLVRLGHAVDVYDDHEKPGGILRYGIPSYRLPRDVLDKEVAFIGKLGAVFKMGVRVGRDVRADELAASYDAAIVAVGAWGDRPLGVPGEALPGVYPGFAFLEDFNRRKKAVPPGKRVLVLGGGNVAIDAARTLLRSGASVTVAYRRTRDDMSANAEEIQGAEDEGISFVFMAAPEAFLPRDDGRVRAVRFVRMAAGPVDRSGRPAPVPTDERFELECDAAVVAVGERVEARSLGLGGLETEKSGTVSADPFSFATTVPRVWVAGDAVTGPATAAEAMGLAKRTARAVDFALTGQDRLQLLDGTFEYKRELPLEPETSRMHRSRRLGPGERRNNFHEINLGYTGEQALAEAARCLRCDVRE